jgi:predicted nuclease of predicted toxin-antitoxin system
MTERIRFHFDENVDPAVAEGLRRRGIDVTLPVDSGLIGADDAAHLAYAIAEQRVIVTHDEDFLAIASRGNRHPGIAYCHVQARSVGELIGALLLIHDCLSPAEMQNHIEFL